MDHEELIISLPHCTIAALAWGPADGKPILALHGWLDNAASFVPLAQHLNDFRLIAIDLPGHGLSSHSPPGSYVHFQDYIADVIRIFDHFAWQECSLLGHSLGAGVASLVAGTIPERINSLALLDGIGALVTTPEQIPKMLRKTICDYLQLEKKQTPIYSSMQEAIDARATASKMLPKSIELLVERGIIAADGGFKWRTDPRLMFAPLMMLTENQIVPFLQAITARSCFIRPQTGWPYDEEVINNRLEQVENIETIKIPGDHHVHMDNPDTVGPLLQKFFVNALK